MHALRKNNIEDSIERSLQFTNIAIISDNFSRDSPALGDMKGLIRRGYNVYPINQEMAANDSKLDRKEVFESVSELEDEIQIVVVHVTSERMNDVIQDLSLRTELWADVRTLWIEPDIDIPKQILSDAHDFGWMVVENRCILAEVLERNISHI
ncbi:MAG: hypothetical protein HOE69_00700 [Euryarchaeota archaeon]|jgi:predicted CoA-binding protein|nr:hypothetical protein [Euryarchaeota archaeon]